MRNAHRPQFFSSGPQEGPTPGTLLTVQQVADQLRVSRSLIYEEIKRGNLSTKRIGRCIRIAQSDLDRYVHAPASTDPESV